MKSVKVRMLDSETDRHTGAAVHYRAGQTYDVPQRIADAWLRIGLAERVKKTKKATTKKGGE